MAQLAQGLRLDLANPLAGNAEPLPHFFQGPLVPVDQAKPQLQHAPFARRQGVEYVLHLRSQHRQRGGVRGRGRLLVFDEVAQMRIFLLADRSSSETGSWETFTISLTFSALIPVSSPIS